MESKTFDYNSFKPCVHLRVFNAKMLQLTNFKWGLILLSVFICCAGSVNASFRQQLNSGSLGTHLKMEDLVEPLGYPIERHLVRTEDGYILGLYHIKHGKRNQNIVGRRPVVYLQHGLIDSSAAFAMNGENGSLAFVFADAGFDVWLGNSRGNSFSNYDMQESMTHDLFWDFSLDEMINYDLPTTLEYVLEQTSVQKLLYVGHSQGTAIAHALFSTQHPITQHIALAVMLAPVAFVKHITSIFLQGLALVNTDTLLKVLGYHQFIPSTELMHIFGGALCRRSPEACGNLVAVLCGYNPENIDPNKWETFLKYTPAGTSVKTMAHWGQGVRRSDKSRFLAFDYGTRCWSWRTMSRKRCNQFFYHHTVPIEYDLNKIRVPLVFYRGGRDALADIRDIEEMKSRLVPGVLLDEHTLLDYEHLDFVWGMDAPERICLSIMTLLEKTFGPEMNLDKPLFAQI